MGYYHIKLWWYWQHIPIRIRRIRKKNVIKVLFVLETLNDWKTEMLYKAMSQHHRFTPIIGLTNNTKYPYAKKDIISYISPKGYNYVDLNTISNSIDVINPDIIFYSSPYSSGYTKGHYFNDNLKYVFCGVDYCLNITKHAVHLDHPWYDYCWQFYVEHEDVRKRKREILGYRARNIKVTGVPIQDMLLLSKENFSDPWRDKTEKKRIIYAPHHSIKGTNNGGIEYATFLEIGESVLDYAKKYHDKITIAFKPHPFLYVKLLEIWGKDRTDRYYQKWRELSNTQYENGEYFGLFKYSDAIIHDSASFIVEYLYIDKPSLFLVSESNSTNDMFDFVVEGYNCYEKGRKAEDVENFIKNVIDGTDVKKNERQEYISKQLAPIGGHSACENIINSILGI